MLDKVLIKGYRITPYKGMFELQYNEEKLGLFNSFKDAENYYKECLKASAFNREQREKR